VTDPQIHRDLGRIDATLSQQGEQIRRLVESNEATDQRVKEMHDVLMQARGGWKTLLTVGAISSALTTVVLKLWTILRGGG